MYWAIVEFQNGLFDCIRAPYDSQSEAYDHLDKIREYRKKNPNPIRYSWLVIRVYNPSYIA